MDNPCGARRSRQKAGTGDTTPPVPAFAFGYGPPRLGVGPDLPAKLIVVDGRRIERLLRVLDAETRFQAGAQALRRGWLTARTSED
ncbi:hypothetical protein ACFVZH_36400 [Streptomyces sp. NPDC059534]|uniref:hypothetical protein n=1 Tax=Streptomyces sp. NPDC059534 TaxID=3346859 RepID=UPI0036939F54